MEVAKSEASESESDESPEEQDEAEQVVVEPKVLPSRSSRGTRIHKLLGEAAEADEAFWGQSAWLEDAEDEDYSTEEGRCHI